MAYSTRYVKKKHPAEDKDSIITVKQERQTGDSVITLKQPHDQTGNSTITMKQQHQTGDSIITVKHEHQTGDSIITVKHENQTGDSLISVKKQQHPTGRDSFYITVKVVSHFKVQNPHFRIGPDEPLQQLKMSWKDRERIPDYQKSYFVFNGRRINDDDENKTANDIGLKDGDSIHVILVLTGD